MREGWTYKKLGEVCTSITDGSHNPPKGIEHSEYRMISSQNIFDDEIRINDGNVRFLTEEDHYKENKRTKLSKDVVLLTIVGTIGRACVLKGTEGFITLQRSVAALQPSPKVYPRFLMHGLIGNRRKLEQEAHGIAQRGIYLRQLSELEIPIPPLSEQQSIVAELDKINELISLKKAQLSDLDNLAQSIFYDMFGDPIENEKGWELSSLKQMGELGRGISKHRPRNAPELLGGNMPLIQTGDVANADMYIRTYNSTYSDLGIAQSKVWKSGTLCITIAATIGKCSILDFDACFPDSVVGFTVNSNVCNNEYVYFIFSRLQSILEENAPAVAQKNINLKVLNELDIPLPPLSLQQEFAKRIELIEKQKVQISSTIKDLETLLASRMQYWFD